MRFSQIAVFGTLVAAAINGPLAYAAECTPEQLEMDGGSKDDAALAKACPALDSAGSANVDFTDLGSFDVNALMALSPCKDKTCTDYLKKELETVPDCELLGMNLQKASLAVLDICIGIAEGTITADKIEELFGGIVGNMTSPSASGSNGDGSTEMPTDMPTDMPTTSPTTDDSDSGSKSTAPAVETPVPSTTSGSSMVTIAGATVAATATLASMLMM